MLPDKKWLPGAALVVYCREREFFTANAAPEEAVFQRISNIIGVEFETAVRTTNMSFVRRIGRQSFIMGVFFHGIPFFI